MTNDHLSERQQTTSLYKATLPSSSMKKSFWKLSNYKTVTPLLLYLGQTALQTSIVLCFMLLAHTYIDREALLLIVAPCTCRRCSYCLSCPCWFCICSGVFAVPFPRLKRKRPHHVYGKFYISRIWMLVGWRGTHHILQSDVFFLLLLVGWLVVVGNESGWIYQCLTDCYCCGTSSHLYR